MEHGLHVALASRLVHDDAARGEECWNVIGSANPELNYEIN